MANPNRSAQALLGLTALILVLAPGSGGAVTPLATGLFALGGAAILAILAAEPALLAPAQNPRLRWLGVAMGGVLALGALQLLPLGPLLAYLSPASGALRTPQGGADSLGCIALYPDHARQALVGLVVAAAIFLVCARALPKKGPEHLAKLLILAALVQVAYGVLIMPSLRESWFARAHGAYPSPNHFGLMLALCLPLAVLFSGVYSSERPPRAVRVGWGLAAAALALGLVASRSRSAVLAAVAAVVVQALLSRDARTKGRTVLVTLLGLALAVATAGWHALGTRFGDLVEGGEVDRVAFWQGGLEVWTRFPVFGAGLRSHDELTPSLIEFPRLVNATHNDYINVLADLGLVGAGLIALGVGAYAVTARVGMRRARGPERRLGAALLAGLAAVAVASAFEFNLQIRANLWITAALAGLGLAALLPRRETTPLAGSRSAAWATRLGWVLLTGAVLLATVGARMAAAAWSLKQGSDVSLPEAERVV
ncbi:MAG: O-antigen ligase family protein, partial [Planctomycetes bacterium]|nr:O-antigen ligase family protein [Planctomycetota bacterium]